MPLETRPFDVAEILDSEERVEAYLEEAFESADPALIASAIGDVMRSRKITGIAKDAGAARESLHRVFSAEGNPTLATIISMVNALGFRLAIKPSLH